jgi:ATP-dependent RNA helicase DDX23/PRP28
MLKRKKLEEESKSKVWPFNLQSSRTDFLQPKFLSKEERARIAMEKRAKEVAAKRAEGQAKVDAVRNSLTTNSSLTDRPTMAPQSIPTGPRGGNYQNGRDSVPYNRSGRDESQFRSATDGRDHSNGINGRSHSRDSPEPSNGSDRAEDEAALDGSELASMRARYMGIAPQKTKKRRLNDRKFVFDWSTEADTSTSNIQSTKAINVGFGRGHFGGFDHASNLRGGLDRHWTEKELIEMTERDWRIFREDFSISTKGALFSFSILTS